MTRVSRRQDVEIAVHGLAHDGRGVGRAEGKTVFVAGALPGERVSARIERSHARFDEAHTLAVLEPSPARVVPPCPHHGSCGGCVLQHLDAEAQLAARQRQLEETLARVARVQAEHWLAPVASAPWEYRARARFAVGHESGRAVLGFRREDSRHVVPIASCAVLEPALAALVAPLAELLGALSRPRALAEIRVAAGEPGVGIAFDCSAEPSPADRELLEAFCAQRGAGFALRVGRDGAWSPCDALLGYDVEPGLRLGFAPWHFTQANRAVNRLLVARALELLAPRPGDRALDLFCGIGNFTLPLARRVARVTGVDGGPAEIAQARANATASGASGAEFHLADLAHDPGQAGWARARYDLVMLDPPRAGAAALVPLLGRTAARHIAYVSCDPATLARDAARLAALGFTLTAAGVFDMFPHTAHLESLAVFRRR